MLCEKDCLLDLPKKTRQRQARRAAPTDQPQARTRPAARRPNHARRQHRTRGGGRREAATSPSPAPRPTEAATSPNAADQPQPRNEATNDGASARHKQTKTAAAARPRPPQINGARAGGGGGQSIYRQKERSDARLFARSKRRPPVKAASEAALCRAQAHPTVAAGTKHANQKPCQNALSWHGFWRVSCMAAWGGAEKLDDKTEVVRGGLPPPQARLDAGDALRGGGAGKGASILKDRAARPYARRDTAKNALARFAASRRRNAVRGATPIRLDGKHRPFHI